MASLINFATARVLLQAGPGYGSITLEADAHHLLTDVWTSAGVIVAVLLVGLTGWLWLDPVIALLVAVNIVWTGYQLLRRSTSGLMDASLDRGQIDAIEAVLAGLPRPARSSFTALRTRRAGTRAFVPCTCWCRGLGVQQGHDWLERIEADIRRAVPGAHVTTHLEPREDPLSMADEGLDRAGE